MQLTQDAARALMVTALGLGQRPAHPATKSDVLDTIRSMGILQIDTIHVVARSPYFVLWSRLGSYEQVWLDELLAEGKLFEYWSHAACFIPIEDYPLYRRLMIDKTQRVWSSAPEWIEAHQEVAGLVLEYIREHGETRTADFERLDRQAGGWWNWKPEKLALEALFTTGDLMIARRQKFQRVYNLRERVLPTWDDSQTPTIDEVQRRWATHAVRALGVTPAAWVPDYFRTSKKGSVAMLEGLADEGALHRVEVEGWKTTGYVHPDNMAQAAAAAAGGLKPTLTTLLSPFDPLTWDRTRATAMFGFDYLIECYTPEAKRRYGYFSLPILRRGALVGRLDAKAHRKDGIFEVKALYLEPGVTIEPNLISDIAGALRDCADWHKTPQVIIRKSEPDGLAATLEQAANAALLAPQGRD